MNNKIVNRALNMLSKAGLDPWIYHRAGTGSIYIKFLDERLGTLRIADHPGKKKYRYKWNIRTDMQSSWFSDDSGIRRFFFTPKDLQVMVNRMEIYYINVLREYKAS